MCERERVRRGSAEKFGASPKHTASQRAALVSLLCLFGFVGLWLGALVLYPGGSWLDRSQIGPSFLRNFLCDLTQPISLSGVANPVGSRLAQSGMLCFAGALAGLFWVVPRHFAVGARAPSRAWERRAGLLALVSFVAVPLTPSEQFGNAHAALALLSGAFGIAAALGVVRTLFTSERGGRALGVLGAMAIAVGAFDGAIFVWHLGDRAPPPLLAPAAQQLAALLVGVWIGAVALAVLLGKDSRGS
jgi:hypothetical protein